MSATRPDLASAFRANRVEAIAGLGTRTAKEAETAYAEIVSLVLVMNAEINQAQKRGTGSEGTISDELLERLLTWIPELRKKLAEIAARLQFQSCSIAVLGPAPAVSVTVTFGAGRTARRSAGTLATT